MNVEWHEFEKLLTIFQGKIETIEEIQRQKGETFNLFSILKMERREVETHSALIYDLINPEGSHSQGKKYLKLFVDNVLSLKGFDFTNINVKREDPTDEGRRIDFTIQNSQYFIAIEMKIDAGDQDNQLLDYEAYAKNQGKESKIYYLTLDGKDATNKSTQGKVVEYKKLSFSIEILDWIELSIEQSATMPIIRESLIQYANIIRKITGQTTQEITMEAIDMINNPKIAEAATVLASNIGKVWAKKEAFFWESLYSQLDNQEWEHRKYYLKKEEVLTINENFSQIIERERMLKSGEIGIEISLLNINFYISFSNRWPDTIFYSIHSDDKNKIKKIIEILKFHSNNEVSCYKDIHKKIKFYGVNTDVTTLTYSLFNEEEFQKQIDQLASEIKEYINKVRDYLQIS